MTMEKQQSIALMGYSAISPLISGTSDDISSLSAYFRGAAARGVKAPDGTVRHYSEGTIEKWHYAYKDNGFNGPIPKGRSGRGAPRKVSDGPAQEIRYIKQSYPRLPSAEIYKQPKDKGPIKTGQLPESTLLRFINQMMLTEKLSAHQEMRRCGRPHINEAWCGGSSYGPCLKAGDGKKHRVYVIALIDDASRFITGVNVFSNDAFASLMPVTKSAVSRYGRPGVFNSGNGPAYKDRQMELLAARIGSAINYCHPYTPTQKAKIERWSCTPKNHWMASP